MTEALKRLLTSAKVWTVIVGSVVTAGASMFAKWGMQVSDTTVSQIAITVAGLVAVLVHAQGQADLGKNAQPTTTNNVGSVVVPQSSPAPAPVLPPIPPIP